MRRAVQETRYRAHGHAPESAAHHRAEDQSIADISGHKSGYNIRHVHANDFDIQLFIFIFDLIAACFHALGSAPLLSQSGKFMAAEGLERQISSRLGADVEMLVKPPFRRNQKASRSPVVALNILPLRPHD